MLGKSSKKEKEETVDLRDPEEIRKEEKRARIRARIRAFHRQQLRKKVKYVYLALAVFLTDQLSKWYVMEYVIRPRTHNGGESMGFFDWYIHTPYVLRFPAALKVLPFFNVVMVWNYGISFGLLGSFSKFGYIILIVIALAIIALFCLWMYEAKTREYMIPYALVIGGALGNVIDRFRFQAVMDFLDFHSNGVHFWAFNVADMAVVTGVVSIIGISQYKTTNRKKRYRKNYKERQKKVYRYGNVGR
ncbi:MAG: signal peptidase II [Alphaproteobacteria bacterium]|nr:signal peptidase II [Alphaproteobacteria bacterium]